ncbi:MAG: putative siderophore transport system ATP-binding protein YusV [Pseudomonadota bacterium]|jgi:iron complex transport system ATP-binding protein
MSTLNIAMRLENVHASLAGTDVLRGINISFSLGRWTSILGPNGAGKSTLLKAMAGLIPSTGNTFVLDQELKKLEPRQRAQMLSWLGQNETVSDDLSVWDVVMLGRIPHQDWLAPPNAVDHQVVTTALRATQVWDLRERSVGQLSGGERQRVLLARAMAVCAPIMLMDEPMANLDPPHQVDWLEQVRCLTAQNTTVISVLHEVGLALLADDVVVMQSGVVVYQGACSDAETHKAIESVFDNRISIHRVDGQWVALPKI